MCWYLWVISWLRSHGVTNQIVFTVDNGEESGGKSWMRVKELRKLIAGFGCRLIQNHKGHCEENAHFERSHRTDDEEFYIPRAFKIRSDKELLDESMGYIYYYNNIREHSALNYQSPFQFLKHNALYILDSIRYTIPVLLDNAAVNIGPWSGYNVLAQNQILKKQMTKITKGETFNRLLQNNMRGDTWHRRTLLRPRKVLSTEN